MKGKVVGHVLPDLSEGWSQFPRGARRLPTPVTHQRPLEAEQSNCRPGRGRHSASHVSRHSRAPPATVESPGFTAVDSRQRDDARDGPRRRQRLRLPPG